MSVFKRFRTRLRGSTAEAALAAPTPVAAPPPKSASSAKPSVKEQTQFWKKIVEWARGAAIQKATRPLLRSHSYRLPDPPPGVLPAGEPKAGSMAMDSAISATYQFAQAAEWAGSGFMGYALLAELTQIPEFRIPCAQLANDMTRQWGHVTSTSKDGESDQIEEKIKLVEAEFDRLGARELFRWGFEKDNEFGRSQIFLDLGEQDGPELLKPLDPKIKIEKGGLKNLVPVEPYWCYPNRYETENPLKVNFYRPESWFVNGREVHTSRFLTFNSRPVPDILKPAYLFGGIPLIQLMWVCVENWLRTRQSVSDLTNAFSTMVLQTDMAQNLSGEGAELLAARAEAFTILRDNMGLFVTSKSSEDFKNVSAPLGSLDKLQAQAQEHMAAVALIPLVVMFGISPAGLNASSEGELQVYDGNIKSIQERIGTPNIKRLLDCVQMSLFGEIDPSLGWQWNPLRQMSAKDLADIRKAETETDCALIDHGVVDPLEVRKKIAAEEDSPYSGIEVDELPAPADPSKEESPLDGGPDGGAAPPDSEASPDAKLPHSSGPGKLAA